MSTERTILRLLPLLMLALCLLAPDVALAGEDDLLPLGGELPDEETLMFDDTGAADSRLQPRIATAMDSEQGAMTRAALDLSRWGLALRLLHDPAHEEILRVGALLQRGRSFLGAGGLGGGWNGGLLLSRRRRARLGSVPRLGHGRDADAPPPLRPSTSTAPLLRGIVAGSGIGPVGLRACQLGLFDPAGDGAAESGQGVGLNWRHYRLDLFRTDTLNAVAVAWRHGGAELELSLEGGYVRPLTGTGGRSGLTWRAHYEFGELRAAGEALVISGATPSSALLRGWLTGQAGREEHFSVGGRGPAGSTWQLARRRRLGLGLGYGGRRLETGLRLGAAWQGGRLELSARQLTELRELAVPAAPGFPRCQLEKAVRQECSVSWRGSWRTRWTWRGGGTGDALLLTLSGAPCATRGWRPLAPLTVDLSVFSVREGQSAFLIFDGAGLYRRVEALRGEGWRLSLDYPRDIGSVALRPGFCLTREPGDTPWRVACWLECRLAN
ncbi:MAG: hypothetical protein GY835_09835 [bacterium]|nr:hypothetical protein [bacterium]